MRFTLPQLRESELFEANRALKARLLRSARNDGELRCHCEERSDAAIPLWFFEKVTVSRSKAPGHCLSKKPILIFLEDRVRQCGTAGSSGTS